VKNFILAGMLTLSLMGIAALAFQKSNKKPTPRPSPAAGSRATPKPAVSPPRGSTTLKPSPSPNGTPISFLSSVFAIQTLVFLLAAGLVAFGIGLSIGQVTLHETGSVALRRAAEAAILAVLGGLLARSFIAFLLSSAKDPSGAQIAVGWGFFIIPGAVDSFAKLFTGDLVTTPAFLLWMAMIVGAFTGMMNGLWQIHDWKGMGWLAFPLDVTWGLAGATTGALMHLIDAIATKHATEIREDAHRYEGGMRLKSTFALTQGAVMSNLKEGPSAPGQSHNTLYYHERTHVWQNRIFGPLFTLASLVWMGLLSIPAAIGAIVLKNVRTFESLCYYNSPWETWAYLVGAGPRTGRTDDAGRPIPWIWGNLAVLGVSIPFFLGIISLFVWIVSRVWL
jgi:hypothetical protein